MLRLEGLSKMPECRIQKEAAGLSIFAIQHVEIKARSKYEQRGHNASHPLMVGHTT